ncbi:MAG TPA: DNA-3-methyladenine glycosylase [Bacteroidales bacterium]|nr:DNA-3-methyladenine glycosylase [Bacteroidales bacterium]
MKLPRSFYLGTDVVEIARNLIGKKLFTNIDGHLAGGIIVETEAYAGVTDRASHAFGGRRTARTAVMYQKGGTAYVYLCYGMHALFNIVTNAEEIPEAVLIRGMVLEQGRDIVEIRMPNIKIKNGLISGPGRVAKALGIKVVHTGTCLLGNLIWLEHGISDFDTAEIITTPRIGIDYAGQDALLPYRFVVNLNSSGL